MKICRPVLILALSALGPIGDYAAAQVAVSPPIGKPLILTNRAALNPNVAPAITPQSIAPSISTSNITPAIGRPGITPAMPTPGAAAIVQTQGFNPTIGRQGFGGAIGQQGSGTAIGQQGTGTAIGQQGSGTAIGQQGTGTAIIPDHNAISPGPSAIVIGQPEPLEPAAPAAAAPVPNSPGFGTNLPNRFGQSSLSGTNAAIRPVMPSPATSSSTLPSGRTLTPTGRR